MGCVTENKALQVFNNPEFGSVRTVVIDEDPWFIGADVATALGYTNPRKALGDHVDGEDKNTVTIRDGIKGNPNKTVINESGMYSLIISSKPPTAKKFKHWVTSEVLPDIRKHGLYAKQSVIDMMIGDPDSCIALLTKYKEEKQAKEQLRIELDKSKEWYTIKRVAQLNGVSWKYFSWRKLKQTSAELGYGVKKIFDANYGNVNVYHVKVWKCVYPNLEL